MGKNRKSIGFLISLFAAGAFVMGASSGAMAGSLITTSKTIAAELLSAANTTPIADSGSGVTATLQATAPISYTPGANMITGATFDLKLTNAQFSGNSLAAQLDIGADTNNSNAPFATCALAASGTAADTVNCTVAASESLSATTIYSIKVDNGSNVPTAYNPILNINKGLSAGDAVSMAVVNSSIAGADAPAVAMYNIKNQFSATLTPVTSKISFADAMKLFVVPNATSVTTSVANVYIKSDGSLDNKLSIAATGSGHTTGTIANDNYNGGVLNGSNVSSDSLDFTVKGNLAGVKSVISSVAPSPSEITAGKLTRSVTGTSISVNGSKATTALTSNDVTITVDGSTVITPRQFTTAADFALAGDFNQAATLFGDTVSHIWQLNATQYYIPLIKSDSANGISTYIKIQSKSTVVGSNGVSVQILASDGTMVTYTPSASTITSGTPYVITGAQLVTAAAAAGHSVNGTMGFAAIVTVNAPEADIFTYANIMDPSGAKRIPVETVGGKIVE